MTEFRFDLHCHSTCSDGTDAPERLLTLAKEKNLQGLSITDHDTLSAYTPSLFDQAKELGLRLLPGIECSAAMEGHSVHILGYGRDLSHPSLQTLLSLLQNTRKLRNQRMIAKLQEKKIDVSDVLSIENLGRPHTAKRMVEKGYVASIGDAFEKYLKEGASCYVSLSRLTPSEVIALLHEASWKAVLAHPHAIFEQRILHALLELPFDGLECFYSYLSPLQERAWVQYAKKKGWLVTGGSDYHGFIKPHIQLGIAWVGKEEFDALER